MEGWYYGVDGVQCGPVDEPTLRQRIAAGEVGPDPLVWREGMSHWAEWSKVAQSNTQGMALSPYQPPPTIPAAPVPRSDGYAITSFICGVASIVLLLTCFLGILAAIPAVIFGHLSLKQLRESPFPLTGRGLAITGLVCGYLVIVLSLLPLVILFVILISNALNP